MNLTTVELFIKDRMFQAECGRIELSRTPMDLGTSHESASNMPGSL